MKARVTEGRVKVRGRRLLVSGPRLWSEAGEKAKPPVWRWRLVREVAEANEGGVGVLSTQKTRPSLRVKAGMSSQRTDAETGW